MNMLVNFPEIFITNINIFARKLHAGLRNVTIHKNLKDFGQ